MRTPLTISKLNFQLFLVLMTWQATAQNPLAFTHSRVVRETYGTEISAYNQMLFQADGQVMEQEVTCTCAKRSNGWLAIQFVWQGNTRIGNGQIILETDGYVLKDASFTDMDALNYESQKLTSHNLKLSDIDISKTDLRGVFKTKYLVADATAKEIYLVFRFFCVPGEVDQMYESDYTARTNR